MSEIYTNGIWPMFEKIYTRLRRDFSEGKKTSPVFTHHIDFINNANRFNGWNYLEHSSVDDVVTDYIASMTDDYFVDLYRYLFNEEPPVKYKSYFENV